MIWWGCALAVLLALTWWGSVGARRALHPPARSFDLPASVTPSRCVTLASANGPRELWLFDAPQPRGVVLVCHGFYGSRRQVAAMSSALVGRGYTTVVWDLPGHGERRQEPCTFGAQELRDIGLILSWTAQDARLASCPIAFLGWSFGGAIACQAAARYPACRAVVLDSAFARLYPTLQRATRRYGYRVPWFSGWLTWMGVQVALRTSLRARDPARLAPKLMQPLLAVHGEADQTVPAADTRELCAVWGGPTACWIEPGIGHVGMFEAAPERYIERVTTFLDECLAPSRPSSRS
ncbi:MAG: alpha/beta fold hydrolase [Candidatus Omnitrophica bacterium]|nr:alpha/beta fold hydrolase [Candidatus Omnitrophota bacterium]